MLNRSQCQLQSEWHPDIAFIHIYPGTVDTPAFTFLWVIRLLHPILKYLVWTPEDCAENMMYPLFSSQFTKGPYWLGQRADKKTLGKNVTDEIARRVWEHTIEIARLE